MKTVFVFHHHLSHRFDGSELYLGTETPPSGIFFTLKFKAVLRGLLFVSMNVNRVSAESVTNQFSKGTITWLLQENALSQTLHKCIFSP